VRNSKNVNTYLTIASLLLVVVMPSLAVAEDSLSVTSVSPTIGVQTEPIQFSVGLQNNGEPITLNTQTSLDVNDGSLTYSASLTTETTIENGASATLLFSMESVPSAFVPGSYIPVLTCQGLAGGETFTEVLNLIENPVEIKPNLSQLSEEAGVNWPHHPSNGCLYPYLVWLSNTGDTDIVLDERSRIAITDGNNLYAKAALAVDANLPASQVTKIEFEEVDFGDAPAGQYQASITLFGPSYSQTMLLDQNPIEVISGAGASLGGGPSTAYPVLATDEQITQEILISTSQGHDQLIHFAVSPKGGRIPYPDEPRVGEYSFPAFCDIDSDGDLDFFTGGSWGDITFVENSGTPTEPSWGSDVLGYESIRVGDRSKPAFVDIDADGDADLFVGDADGNLWFYRNLGTPSEPNWISSPRPYPDVNAGVEVSPTFADIDADGDFDLFVGCADGTLSYLENIGTQNLPSWADAIAYAGIDVNEYSIPVFADINNDGDHDLLIGCGDGTIAFMENIGTAAAAQWGTVITNYAGIDVGARAAPALADIDADGDFDLFVGREPNEGVVFYRNTGTSLVPAWTMEAFSPTYIKPAQAPRILTWDPPPTALITDSNVSFIGTGPIYRKLWYYVTFASTGQELMGVEYDLPIYAKTVNKRTGSGIIIGAGVKLLFAATFDDDCEAIISGISTQTPEVYRTYSFEVQVHVTNPKPYWLPIHASTLTFWQDQNDVSDKFSVEVAGAGSLQPHWQTTLIFAVTPLGDAPLGEVLIDPVVTTQVSRFTAVNWGSAEWPTPRVSDINVLPSSAICSDTSMLAIQETGTGSFGVKLLDQPPGELVVSVAVISGDPDISIQSGSSLLFTPENWDMYQPVTIAASPDADANHDTALLRCSADGYVSKDVKVLQYEEPSDFYVNDDLGENGFAPGDDNNWGITPLYPMRTIQGLLDRYPTIGTGSTVYVSNGMYIENITIGSNHSGLSLLGSGPENTTIHGANRPACIELDNFGSGLISNFSIRWGPKGIYCYRSSPAIVNNKIVENGGSGIYCWEGGPQIIDNIIQNNPEGIYLYQSCAMIANNLISNNSTGICCWFSGITITNNTIAGHTREYAIDCFRCSPTIANNIVAFNFKGINGTELSPVLRHNCVYDNQAGDYSGTASPGTGDISIDPNFINWEIRDYHLSHDSHCIDAGDNNSIPEDSTDLDGDGDISELIPYDLDGLPRVTDGDCTSTEIVDMGAYELLRSDINSDKSVDFVDISRLGSFWKETDCGVCDGADLTCDGNVDFDDLRQLVAYWLAGGG